MLLANFFFYLREKTIFFFGDQRSTNFLFRFRRRMFLSYAFSIMYVTIWCFFWSTYFSSISTTNFFFCPHFQQTFFFYFCGDKLFISILPTPPPQISNGASLTIGETVRLGQRRMLTTAETGLKGPDMLLTH